MGRVEGSLQVLCVGCVCHVNVRVGNVSSSCEAAGNAEHLNFHDTHNVRAWHRTLTCARTHAHARSEGAGRRGGGGSHILPQTHCQRVT